jgi:hypothetical protein
MHAARALATCSAASHHAMQKFMAHTGIRGGGPPAPQGEPTPEMLESEARPSSSLARMAATAATRRNSLPSCERCWRASRLVSDAGEPFELQSKRATSTRSRVVRAIPALAIQGPHHQAA